MRYKFNTKWIKLDPSDCATYPPPMEKVSIMTKPGVLYPKCDEYVLCNGKRISILTMTLFYADGSTKDVSFNAIDQWRPICHVLNQVQAKGSR